MADIKLMQLKTLTTPNLQRTESPVEISMKRGRVSQDLKMKKKRKLFLVHSDTDRPDTNAFDSP